MWVSSRWGAFNIERERKGQRERERDRLEENSRAGRAGVGQDVGNKMQRGPYQCSAFGRPSCPAVPLLSLFSEPSQHYPV